MTLVEELGPRLRGADERAAVATIEAAIDDLRVARHWRVSGGHRDAALRLPAALHDYLLFRLHAESVRWAERALAMAGADHAAAYPAALATAALGAANRGALDRAREWAEEALVRGEGLAALHALATLSVVALYEGRLDDVLTSGARLATLAEAWHEPYYVALSHLNRALALHYHGEQEAATERVAALEEAARAVASPTLRAWAAYVRGEISMDADPPLARRQLAAAAEAAREAGSRLSQGAALVSLASASMRAGQTGRHCGISRRPCGCGADSGTTRTS